MMMELSTGELTLLLTLLFNVGALVWGAATLAASQRELAKGMTRITDVVAEHDKHIHRHETRLTVLEKVG
jgi:hypothetical protein